MEMVKILADSKIAQIELNSKSCRERTTNTWLKGEHGHKWSERDDLQINGNYKKNHIDTIEDKNEYINSESFIGWPYQFTGSRGGNAS